MKRGQQNTETSRFAGDDPTQPAFSMPNSSTSGQFGPKSQSAGYRQQSAQARPSERARQGEAPSDGASGKRAAQDGHRQQKYALHMEKTGAKLDKARGKLSKQKPPKKPSPVGAARHGAWNYAHKKIYEVEQENTAIEAAHRTELAGEGAVHAGSRFIKRRVRTRPARRARMWEKKDIKAHASHEFSRLAQENPALHSNPLSRFWQKRKLKAKYAKQMRDTAKCGARAAKKTAVTTEKIVQRITHALFTFVRHHPVVALVVGLLLALILVITSVMSSCTAMGNGLVGAAGAAAYQASDADMTDAERRYRQWETEMLLEAQNVRKNRPGYDEYRFEIDEVYHDPHALMSYLTTKYGAFTLADIEADLRALFEQQYTLEFKEITETRYRNGRVQVVDPMTREVTYETRRVPYDWRVLLTKLTSRPFGEVVGPLLSGEGELERYALYYDFKGGRQYIASPFPFDWQPYISSYFGYRIHPITGEQDYHMGLDITVAAGTPILAGGEGVVREAGWHESYGNTLLVDYGTVTARYAHCSVLLVGAGKVVAEGDVIAKVGSTGDSTGPHLHLELRKDGQLIDPIYFTGIPLGG